MKKKLLFILACLTTMFASCQKSADAEVQNDEFNSTFIVSAESLNQSRGFVANIKRYVMEVYQGTSPSGDPISHTEQSNNTFNVLLKNGVTYTFLFWIDNADPNNNSEEYNAADLKAVKIVKQPIDPAWSGSVSFTKGSESESDHNVTLVYAVAKVNFIQSENFTQDNNTLKVTFPQTYSLNVANRSITEIKNNDVSVPSTYTFTTTSKLQKDCVIGTSYIIAKNLTSNDDPKTILNLSLDLNNSETTKSITNVPFACKNITNIKGAFSNLYFNTTYITCNPSWYSTVPENNYGSEEKNEVRVGDFVYSDGYTSDIYDSALTCVGVVFYVDPTDKTKGKMAIPVDGTYFWSDIIGLTGMTDYSDGAFNKSNYFAEYESDHYQLFNIFNKDTDLYIPSAQELLTLLMSADVMDKMSFFRGGKDFKTGCYWSSTERSSDKAFCYSFEDGQLIYKYKNESCSLFAIRKF